MQFEPIGGYPSLTVVNKNKIQNKTLESRGFSTTNIVSINDIMNSKKKENLFLAFGPDEEGMDHAMESMINNNPINYKNISYKKIPLKLV